jgi:uridylate kinase
MRYRIINGASAPASTTTFTSTFAAAVDYTEFQTEVIGGSGSSAAGQALAVVSAGTFPVSGAVSLTATSSVTGMSATKMNSLATTNALSIRTAAAKLYSYTFMNTAAATRYVKFYNKASAPTVGTDTPLFTLAIPAGMQVNQTFIFPVTFSTGLATAITAGAADNDATATAVNDVMGWITSI